MRSRLEINSLKFSSSAAVAFLFIATTVRCTGQQTQNTQVGTTQTPKITVKVDPNLAQGAKTVEGDWQGSVSDGTSELRIIIQIVKRGNGFAGTFQVPDRSADILPMKTIIVQNESMHFSFDATTVWWEGKLNDAGTQLNGIWSNGVGTFTLNFTRNGVATERTRPQEPKKPYPYAEQEIRFTNFQTQFKLGATITLPSTPGPYPAVVLLSGTGQLDRDAKLYDHKPFWILADVLTRRGIAVLRIDDRGVGSSAGEADRATIPDYASDLVAGIAYLKTRADIKHDKIGLVGFGEGGVIAPMAAVESKSVAFIVLLADVGVDGRKTLIARSDAQSKTDGATEEELKAYRHFQMRALSLLVADHNPASANAALATAITQEIAKIPEARRPKVLGVMYEMANSYSTPWMRSFIALDPTPTLAQITCPVLALHGDKDSEMSADLHLHAIETTLKNAGNKDVTATTIKGVNHMMQTCKTGATTEYQELEETLSPLVLKMVGDWILDKVK